MVDFLWKILLFFWEKFMPGVGISILTGLIVAYFMPSIRRRIDLTIKDRGYDKQFNLIPGNFRKIYNDVIFLDVKDKNFSEIATNFMKYKNNNEFIITNIQEPCWFFEQFKAGITNEKNGHTAAAAILEDFEKIFACHPIDYNLALTKIKDLIAVFYTKNEITVCVNLFVAFC